VDDLQQNLHLNKFLKTEAKLDADLTPDEISFLRQYCIEEKMTEKKIVKPSGCKTVTAYYAEHNNLKKAKKYIKETVKPRFNGLKQRVKNKKDKEVFGNSFARFFWWYCGIKYNGSNCCYCGIEESQLIKYFHDKSQAEKAVKRQRGCHLEIERVITAPKDKNKYSEENCRLVCYICNNAKSDFLSAENFKPIAKGINDFWSNVMGVTIDSWKNVEKKYDELIRKLK